MRHCVLGAETLRRSFILLTALFLLWGGFIPSAGAQQFLTGLSLTPAPGAGALDIDFTVAATTVRITTTFYASPVLTFTGNLDFGDASPPPLNPVLAFDSAEKIRTGAGDKPDAWASSYKGVISHTYPAPGTYTAVLTHCCLAEIELSYGYLTIITDGTPLTDTAQITVPPPSGGGCEEPTLFKQIACLLGALNDDVGAAGIDATLTGSLQEPLLNAIERNAVAEQACVVGNTVLADQRVNSSRSSVRSFEGRTSSNTGPTLRIPDAVGEDFLAQADVVEQIQTGLIDSDVCAGLECLQDPPLASINCELDKLIVEVTAAGLVDVKLTAFLLKQLTDAKTRKEEAEERCALDKDRQATSKLKATRAKIKSFVNKINQALKKGTIPQATADALLLRAGVIAGKVDALVLAGVCN